MYAYTCVWMKEGYVHINSCALRSLNGGLDAPKLDFQVVMVRGATPSFPTRAGSSQSLSYLSSPTTDIHMKIRIIAVNSWVATFPRQREADFMSFYGVSTPALKDNQPLFAINSTAVSPKGLIWDTHLIFFLNETVFTVYLLIIENYLNIS